MSDSTARRAVAIVGLGGILPDAPDVPTFWQNVQEGRYSITETPRDRWDPDLYYDPDPRTPDKTYSKIGGWVRSFTWDPLAWKLPIPPRVAAEMDNTQRFAVAAAREALLDYGYPGRPLDPLRTAVVLGNAMAGDRHYFTAMRILFPEVARALAASSERDGVPPEQRAVLLEGLGRELRSRLPEITEDTMPGELSNIIAGRIANLFDFKGPNFVCDAACASALAAIDAALDGLVEGEYDAVLTGGVDSNMSASTFVKFCKIGALSATGTRPYADGADGFVMGEGTALFLLKRLADAERDGDRIYAVIRGLAGSSDGRGKGITAPNPVGQRLAVERAWANVGESLATVGLIEGHGTSTRVGDLAELESLATVLGGHGLAPRSVPIGSVKSNIGHLKAGAGAAGLLKAALALHHKVLPPSLHCERPNTKFDFAASPLVVNTELRPWETGACGVRRAGVSAFGFGGTNFHVVLEEHVPGRLTARARESVAVGDLPASARVAAPAPPVPMRGGVLVGGADEQELAEKLRALHDRAAAGDAPAPGAPRAADLAAPHRIAIDFGTPAELAARAEKALKALAAARPHTWRVLRSQGVFRGAGAPAKVAFLYTGQGSQYPNMLADLRGRMPLVADVFAEADRVITPLLGRQLSEIVFVPADDPARISEAEEALRQTEVTQPAVLSVGVALTRALAEHGFAPDFVMGHSLGEYGALVAAGCLSFAEALEAVSARGREMTRLSVGDPGKMAAVFAPLAEIEEVLAGIDGYVVVANINSTGQAVIGGASEAAERAVAIFSERGREVRYLPVSHAFHTRIVAPASESLARMLQRLHLAPPRLPLVSNASGDFYPTGGAEVVPAMIELLARQIAEPVQFVAGLERLYAAGARLFVEVGPKRALQGFVEDVLGDREGVLSLATNHPKIGDVASLNHAICGLWAAGRGTPRPEERPVEIAPAPQPVAPGPVAAAAPPAARPAPMPLPAGGAPFAPLSPAAFGAAASDRFAEIGRLVTEALARGLELAGGASAPRPAPAQGEPTVVVTGAAFGLPGAERVFDDANLAAMLRGDLFIRPVPMELRQAMVERRITRLVKSEAGGPRFETIESPEEVIKLAARAGDFDLTRDFGIPAERAEALDRTTMLAMGAGLDALRDAGIPLVLRYKTTTTGGRLPDRWGLPDELRDETGVIFGCAFPGYDRLVGMMERFREDRERRARLAELEAVAASLGPGEPLARDLAARIAALRAEVEAHAFSFDRRFLFQVLAMGHSQFAEAIGARGPNTQVNSACATTTQAFALAHDWIRTGRCRRVIVIAADDITSDNLFPWFASGFLASGTAATDARVEDAVLPFDRRRHGLVIGMGAAAAVLETAEAARERGLAPICELLGTVTANSAFHGSRLDVAHIAEVMERLVSEAEGRWGLDRHALARELVFVSHETYTPARGGSAQAEVEALRKVFGPSADAIVVANTKGYTGHPMGVGIEDVLAVKTLETGIVPPVPNLKEVDPDLGVLNFSRGGHYPIRYALRLGAGFGSQISMSLLRWVPTASGQRHAPEQLGYTYRLLDPARFRQWLVHATGQPRPELEISHRTLRVTDATAARLGTRSPREKRPESPAAPAPADGARTTPASPTSAAPAHPSLTQQSSSSTVEGRDQRVQVGEGGSAAGDEVAAAVLALVSEKTGYPAEMLALDLDMEADLGIDTVKQAELFAAIRERYGIERDPEMKLRDFPTLAHTIRFVKDRRPDLAAAAATSQPSLTQPSSSSSLASQDERLQVGEGGPSAGDEIAQAVLGLVSQKTGYPPEMLDLDLDMEADLGIDTVKQAELFAAIREKYGIERDPDMKLRDFPTLAHTIRFVKERRPDLAKAAAAAPPSLTQQSLPSSVESEEPRLQVGESGSGAGDEIAETVLGLVSEKTGYPPEMLDLDLDMEADLGIDTVKQAELFAAIREKYGIERDPEMKLRDFPTLAHTIRFVRDRRPDLAAEPTPPDDVQITATSEPTETPAPLPLPSNPRLPLRLHQRDTAVKPQQRLRPCPGRGSRAGCRRRCCCRRPPTAARRARGSSRATGWWWSATPTASPRRSPSGSRCSASRCCRSSTGPRPASSPRGSRRGARPARCAASTGSPPSIRRARPIAPTSPPGGRRCASAPSSSPRRFARSTSRSARRGRSPSPPPASAAAMATRRPGRSRPSAAPSPASPRRSGRSARRPTCAPSTSPGAPPPTRSPPSCSTRRSSTRSLRRSATPAACGTASPSPSVPGRSRGRSSRSSDRRRSRSSPAPPARSSRRSSPTSCAPPAAPRVTSSSSTWPRRRRRTTPTSSDSPPTATGSSGSSSSACSPVASGPPPPSSSASWRGSSGSAPRST
ncbi:MAG: acyltransferase domain-containing protein [Thermoanaerobaculia bacterium]|nr:acyltransferase domain-containing protein [Thermoanaerobaculia bacterium]